MSKPVFQDMFQFSGRRDGRSYLMFQISVILLIMGGIWLAKLAGDAGTESTRVMLVIVFGCIYAAVCVAALLTGAQRCRDIGWSGWFVLLGLIPFVGMLFLLALCIIPGTQGVNPYGPDPRS